MNQHKILIKPTLIKYINKMKNKNILKLEVDNKTKHLEKYLNVNLILIINFMQLKFYNHNKDN